MGYFSQKHIECADFDTSYPDERALLRMRLHDLADRYCEVTEDGCMQNDEDFISDTDLMHILPEHMTSGSVIERATDLTRYELIKRYGEFTAPLILPESKCTECKGQIELVFNRHVAALDAA